jgi:hypothetical protein
LQDQTPEVNVKGAVQHDWSRRCRVRMHRFMSGRRWLIAAVALLANRKYRT